jgi:hypothetical protein
VLNKNFQKKLWTIFSNLPSYDKIAGKVRFYKRICPSVRRKNSPFGTEIGCKPCCGFAPLWCGSGSGSAHSLLMRSVSDFYFHADPDPTFPFKRIRIWLDFDPHQCDTNLPPLANRSYFEPPRLHCERPQPSMAPFWASINSSWILTLMRIRIHRLTFQCVCREGFLWLPCNN